MGLGKRVGSGALGIAALSLAACGAGPANTLNARGAPTTATSRVGTATTATKAATTSTSADLGTLAPEDPAAARQNGCRAWNGGLRAEVEGALTNNDLAVLIRLSHGMPASGGDPSASAPWLAIDADVTYAGGSFKTDFRRFTMAVIEASPDDLSAVVQAERTFDSDCSP